MDITYRQRLQNIICNAFSRLFQIEDKQELDRQFVGIVDKTVDEYAAEFKNLEKIKAIVRQCLLKQDMQGVIDEMDSLDDDSLAEGNKKGCPFLFGQPQVTIPYYFFAWFQRLKKRCFGLC